MKRLKLQKYLQQTAEGFRHAYNACLRTYEILVTNEV